MLMLQQCGSGPLYYTRGFWEKVRVELTTFIFLSASGAPSGAHALSPIRFTNGLVCASLRLPPCHKSRIISPPREFQEESGRSFDFPAISLLSSLISYFIASF